MCRVIAVSHDYIYWNFHMRPTHHPTTAHQSSVISALRVILPFVAWPNSHGTNQNVARVRWLMRRGRPAHTAIIHNMLIRISVNCGATSEGQNKPWRIPRITYMGGSRYKVPGAKCPEGGPGPYYVACLSLSVL